MASSRIFFPLLAAMYSSCLSAMATTLITYPAPTSGGGAIYQNYGSLTGNTVSNVVLSSNYTVTVNGSPSPVYFYQSAMAYFDFSGGPVTVQVTVAPSISVNSVVVRPLRLGIVPQVSGHTITFTLANPQNLDVEVNGDTNNPLFIFANPIDTTAPTAGQTTSNGTNILYYGPGIYAIGSVTLPNNTRVYVAGGAIVYGHFSTNGSTSNSSITGRGIIVADDTLFLNCTNLALEGFIITSNNNPGHWTLRLNNCLNTTIDNIKSFPWQGVAGAGQGWGQDGLDLCGSQNVIVKNSCIRCVDDCIAIKSFNGTGGGNVLNHEIYNNVVWGMGQCAFEIGFEFNCEHVSWIYYHNDDIIHYSGGKAALGIHDIGWGGTPSKAQIENVLYENINIEDCSNDIVDVVQASNLNNADGTINNITYRNVSLLGGGNPGSMIEIANNYDRQQNPAVSDPGNSYNPDDTAQNITFENLNILGKVILNPASGGFNIGANTKNIQFLATHAAAPQAPSTLTAQATGSSTTFLTWTDPAGDQNGYSLERSTDGINYTPLTTLVWPNQTTFSDSGLTSTSKYYYRLRAYNDLNTLSYSPYTTAAPVTTSQVGAIAPVDVYHFDEGSGSSTADALGGNTGTLIGTPLPAWVVPGHIGNADLGFSGNGQYDQVGESAVQITRDLSPVLGGTSSLLFWIKTTQTGSSTHWQAPAVTGVEQTNLGNDIDWGYLDGKGDIGIGVGDSGNCVSTQPINDGQWHHVAITRDANAGVVTVYVDGTASNSSTLESGQLTAPFNLMGGLSVYASGYTGANFLNAQVEEVQVYNQVVSSALIAGLQPQLTTLPNDQNISLSAAPVSLPATTSAGLNITYSVVSGPATVLGNTLTVTGTGTVVLMEIQAGNGIYAPFSFTDTITVTAPASDTPTMPSWGLALMTLLLLISSSRRRFFSIPAGASER